MLIHHQTSARSVKVTMSCCCSTFVSVSMQLHSYYAVLPCTVQTSSPELSDMSAQPRGPAFGWRSKIFFPGLCDVALTR